jgi:RHS repeat-associated protein
VQSEEYYPYGWTFNSFRRENSLQQNYLFNSGSELERGLDLGWYHTLFRDYDPAIGRFIQIDPMADFMPGINPYHFAYDNPVMYNDPDGLAPLWWLKLRANIKQIGNNLTGRGQYHAVIKGRNKGYDIVVQSQLFNGKPKPRSEQVANTSKPAQAEPDISLAFGKPDPYDPEFDPQIPEPHKPEPPKPIHRPKPPVHPIVPDPVKDEYDIGRGGLHAFNDYQFQYLAASIYHTPPNDKLLTDLAVALKSRAGLHLEIRGNMDSPLSNDENMRAFQQLLIRGRAQAIYDALRAAGVPASQLSVRPGNIGASGSNRSVTFILTNP